MPGRPVIKEISAIRVVAIKEISAQGVCSLMNQTIYICLPKVWYVVDPSANDIHT